MKTFLFPIFLFIIQSSFAQKLNPNPHLNPDYYTYHQTKDTIFFERLKLGLFTFTDALQIVDSVQIDGAGAKELVFVRLCKGHKEEHGGTFDISDYKEIKQYEVWNLDSKTLLFKAMAQYKNEYNNSYAYFQSFADCQQGKGTATYQYDFIVAKNGSISISNLMASEACKPDHAVGIYKFVDGNFILQ